MAALATEKLAALRRHLEMPQLPPLPRPDQFDGQFDLPTIPGLNELLTALPASFAEGEIKPTAPPSLTQSDRLRYATEMDGTPLPISKEVWHDRLTAQGTEAANEEDSVQAYVQLHLAHKKSQASGKQVSIGRVNQLRLHLTHFQDQVGGGMAASQIDGKVLLGFYAHLMEQITSQVWSRSTAFDHLSTSKAFVRWLWRSEVIADLPRILDGRNKEI